MTAKTIASQMTVEEINFWIARNNEIIASWLKVPASTSKKAKAIKECKKALAIFDEALGLKFWM